MSEEGEVVVLRRSPPTSALRVPVLMVIALTTIAMPGFALGPPVMMKESLGEGPVRAPIPCSAPENINGSCGNYRWYNFCSGYIWIYLSPAAGDEIGTSFKATEGMPCVAPANIIKRTVTYFRNVVPNYGETDRRGRVC